MPPDPTSLLKRLSDGDAAAANDLMPLVYEELHDLARRRLRHEPKSATLQTTDLVHEAYLRLIDQSRVDWKGRAHFFGIAAEMMRRLILDHAKGRRTLKRGRGWHRLTLSAITAPDLDTPSVDAAWMEQTLTKLARLDGRQARIVRLRLTGLTEEEVAVALGVSRRTVQIDWSHARVWLKREFGKGSST